MDSRKSIRTGHLPLLPLVEAVGTGRGLGSLEFFTANSFELVRYPAMLADVKSITPIIDKSSIKIKRKSKQ